MPAEVGAANPHKHNHLEVFVMRKSFAIVLVGLALSATVAGIAGAASATPAGNGGGKNIVQTAVAAGQFKTLVSLVKQAGLAGALSGPGPLTVFAPTDAAFAKVPKATLTALAHDKAKLKAVLLYHVVKGKLTAAKVSSASRSRRSRPARSPSA